MPLDRILALSPDELEAAWWIHSSVVNVASDRYGLSPRVLTPDQYSEVVRDAVTVLLENERLPRCVGLLRHLMEEIRCPNCGTEHEPVDNNAYCPKCSKAWTLRGGKGFIDKDTGELKP